MTKNYKFFWTSNSPGSNWYPSKFVLDGITFISAEQAMMYYKAKTFGDGPVAEKILKETSQRKIKALGRQVSNFNEKIWTVVSRPIMVRILSAKFSQNSECRDWLMYPSDAYFVEASPYDKIWGIGLTEDDPLAQDEATWKGENRLGDSLNETRDNFSFIEKMLKEANDSSEI